MQSIPKILKAAYSTKKKVLKYKNIDSSLIIGNLNVISNYREKKDKK